MKVFFLLFFILAPLSCTACNAEPGKTAAAYSTLQHLPLGARTTVDACYHSGRHGASLRNCESPGDAGFRTSFADAIRAEPDVRALSKASASQWAPNSRQVLRVCVTGYFERSDLDVAGGQRFLITEIHEFKVENTSAQAH